MQSYIITEERLLELLEAEARFQCLEHDGVDNWEWYMESENQFIADALDISIDEVKERNLDFQDVAEAGLADFEKF